MPLSNSILRHYPNTFFVETGTWKGDGIRTALNVGFPMIISVELAAEHYLHAVAEFFRWPHVRCMLGDSADILEKLCPQIDMQTTFWLDAHYSGLPDMAHGRDMSPILRELAAIQSSPMKTHTILIDDVRLFGTAEFDGTTLDQAKAALLAINPQYEISLIHGGNEIPNDILVARP